MTASDVDVDDTMEITGTHPAWLTLTDNGGGTAQLSGTPTNEYVGTHDIVLTVSDGQETVNQEFTITVANTNDAPEFTSTPTTFAVEDTEYSYAMVAEDIDVGDELTYTAQTLPGWLNFDLETATISGTPTNDNVGDHAVVFLVTDNFGLTA